MPYRYTAYTIDKNVIEGTIDAEAEDLAKERLWQLGYKVISLKAIRPRLSFRQQFPTFFGVKSRDVIVFSRQVATLIERGVSPFSAIQVLREQIQNPSFREIVSTIIEDLKEGSSFAEAVSRHPQAFPTIYCRMVKVGEKTGNLQDVLKQVSEYMEKEKAALKRVKMAMIYPAFILLVACGVVAILMTFTLPPLIDMFTEFEAELPVTTKILIGTTGFVTGYWFYLAPAIVGAAVLAVLYIRTPIGRVRFDRLLLRTPLLGQIITKREMAHFSQTLSLSLNSGLPMVEAMDLAIRTSQNSVMVNALDGIRTQMIQGRGLYQSMSSNQVFPPLMVQMVNVGEQVGTLSKDLETVGDFYEQEVDERVNMMLSLMQPTLILILGLIVAFIAVSVIMPMYSIMGEI